MLCGTSVRALPQQERLVWIFVTDSFGRPIPNISVSTVEWGKPTVTTSNGKAAVTVSGKTNVGDLIHLIISNRYYATVTGAPIGIRVSVFNRPEQPIPISLRRVSTLAARRSISKETRNESGTNEGNPFQKGMRAVRAQRFVEALDEFSSAYDIRREAYQSQSNARTKKEFADVNRELALVLVALNRVREGKEKLQEAIRLNPTDNDSKYLLAIYEYTTGDMQKSERLFNDVMSSRIRTSEEIKWASYFLLAQIYWMYGKLEDSKKLLATVSKELSIRSLARNREINQLIQTISKAEGKALTERTPSYAALVINLSGIILSKAQLGLAEKIEGQYGPDITMLLEQLFNKIPPFKESEKRRVFARLMSTERRLLGHDHLFLGVPLLMFANFNGALDHLDEAETHLLEAKAIFEQSLGKDNYWTALVYAGLGNVYAGREKVDDARSYWNQSQAILCDSGDQSNLRLCAALLGDISDFYKRRTNFAEAIPPLRRALDMEKSLWAGKDAEGTATILNTIDDLQQLYLLTQRVPEIISLQKEKQTIEKMGVKPKEDRWLYDRHLAVKLNGKRCYFMPYFDFIKYPNAKALLEAAAAASKYIDPHDPDVIETKYRLAAIYFHEERYRDAARLIKQALDANEKALEPNRQFTAVLLNLQASINEYLDNNDDAETGYQQAADISSVLIDDKTRDRPIFLYELARVQRDKKNYTDAEKNLKLALELREREDNKLCREVDSVTIVVELANLYIDLGRYTDADKSFQQAIAAIGDCCFDDYENSASILDDYARCLRKMGRETDALKMEARATALRINK